MVAHVQSYAADWCLNTGVEAPLPYQQLTRLQVFCGTHNTKHILAVISDLPMLEELELHLETTFDLFVLDAAALSRWPKLRLLDLSGSQLWDFRQARGPERMPMREVERLMHLQRACPRIEWVPREPGQRG